MNNDSKDKPKISKAEQFMRDVLGHTPVAALFPQLPELTYKDNIVHFMSEKTTTMYDPEVAINIHITNLVETYGLANIEVAFAKQIALIKAENE